MAAAVGTTWYAETLGSGWRLRESAKLLRLATATRRVEFESNRPNGVNRVD